MSAISPATFLSQRSQEAHLLLSCARTTLDLKAVEKIRGLLQHQLNWDYVFRKAREHSIMPLVCRSLNTFPEAVPREILLRFQSDFSAHARRNLFFTSELLKLLALMEENGIRAVAYKGPVLSASAYGNVVLRSFLDLDILIHEQDILRAKGLLLSKGFQTLTRFTKAQEEAHFKSPDKKDIVLVHPNLPIRVELHWRIASMFLFPLDHGLLWERLGTITLGGATVSNLSAEDTLLILCVHGSKHSFKRLQWICDIAELIRANPEIDWDQVTRRAARLGSKRMLSLGLFLATNLLAAAVPPSVARSINADPKVKSLASRVTTSLFNETTQFPQVFADTAFSINPRELAFNVNLREELGDRTRLRFQLYLNTLFKAVTPNVQDREFLRLPAFLRVFYYMVRPVRLVHAYGLSRLMPHRDSQKGARWPNKNRVGPKEEISYDGQTATDLSES